MIKLGLPQDNFSNSLALCIDDIPNSKVDLKHKLERSHKELHILSTAYLQRANLMNLHQFSPSNIGQGLQLVPGCGNELTKNDLVSLYNDFFSKKGSKARVIYNRIKISSKDHCSLCLIGHVSTLDHYLPKARYPAFSIEPYNLIPACAECNKGKGAAVINSKDESVLHPYFSDSKFYEEKWLSAEVIEEATVRLGYYVNPPDTWTAEDKSLIESHFNNFKLAEKFTDYVSAHLVTALDHVDLARNHHGSTTESIKEHFFSMAASRPNKNSPVRAMYEALSQSDWFCSGVRKCEKAGLI